MRLEPARTRVLEASGLRFTIDEAGQGDSVALFLHGFSAKPALLAPSTSRDGATRLARRCAGSSRLRGYEPPYG